MCSATGRRNSRRSSRTKAKSGQRLYTKKDLDNILLVKQLLYKDGYTIAGARKKLNGKDGAG